MKHGRENIPKLLPAAAIPVAKAFLVLKYVLTMATLGTKRHPQPTPIQSACASMICQYELQMLVIIIPKTTRKDPVAISARK